MRKNNRTVEPATPADLKYLIHLQKAWSNNVGFLPRCAFERYIDLRQILLVRENDAPAGYLIWTFRRDGVVRIPQVAVDFDLLRTTLGTKIVQHVKRAAIRGHCSILRLKSRSDLSANRFWPTVGFQPTAVITHPTHRGLPLLEWTAQLTDAATIAHTLATAGRPFKRSKHAVQPSLIFDTPER